jgi:hypothetical protein
MATEDINLSEARELLDGFAAVNLDEVSPETVTVALREYAEDKHAKAGYRVDIAHKEIQTFVPMFMFNRMLANQKRVAKLRKQRQVSKPEEEEAEDDFDFLAEDEPNFTKLTDELFNDILRESEPAIVWQAKEVLNVWRLTPGEQDMTLKKLLLGLDLAKIEGLFTRFFGGMLRRR